MTKMDRAHEQLDVIRDALVDVGIAVDDQDHEKLKKYSSILLDVANDMFEIGQEESDEQVESPDGFKSYADFVQWKQK